MPEPTIPRFGTRTLYQDDEVQVEYYHGHPEEGDQVWVTSAQINEAVTLSVASFQAAMVEALEKLPRCLEESDRGQS